VRFASRGDGVRCEVLAALSFRGLSASSYECFGETFSHSASFSPLKMEVAGCTEILVSTYETAS